MRDRSGSKMRASDCKGREGDDPWELQGLRLSQPVPAGTENLVKWWSAEDPILDCLCSCPYWLQSLSLFSDFGLSQFLYPLQLSLTSLEGKVSKNRRRYLYSNAHKQNKKSVWGFPIWSWHQRQNWCCGIRLKSLIPFTMLRKLMGQRLSETSALFIHLRSLWFPPSLPLLFSWQWCLCRTNLMCHPPSSSPSGKFMLNFPSACAWCL